MAIPGKHKNGAFQSCRFSGWWVGLLFVIGGLAGTGGTSGAELSDHTTDRFSGAGNCAFCHDQWGNALLDHQGRDVSIAGDWRGTMMAHSFKDPLWRAVMEAEIAENREHQAFIEDKCLTCHGAMARAETRATGADRLTMAQARKSPLAGEGVGCTLCHQIEPGNLGQAASFTGNFALGSQRLIYGPYQDVVTMPMQRHVDYTPVFGKHIQESALCATCHTLFTPVLRSDGQVAGQFPEQVPFLEWRASEYAAQGVQCQDCHMPRLDEPIKISARPPWLAPRQPFWRHPFAGGNAFMLRLMRGNDRAVDVQAEPPHFEHLIAESRQQLRRAARLHVSGRREGPAVILEAEIVNLAGHKFPTGHPYRRAWIHVRLADQRGRVLFESGGFDKEGRLVGLGSDFAPHYDLITMPGEVQVYQAVMGDWQGNPTWSLLRGAAYLKDNRLPPRGFKPGEQEREQIATRGNATEDPNFNPQGNGSDRVTYKIAIPNHQGPVSAEVELLYQSVPPETVARLLVSKAPEAKAFAKYYKRTSKAPEIIASTHLGLP